MMELIFFLTVLSLTCISYIIQFYKILTTKTSKGVSLQAYIITFVAIAILTINADASKVFYLGVVEMILSLFGAILIYRYREDTEKLSRSFLMALGASFLMIHGVMQGIKSYSHKGYSSVSVISYLIWILMDIMIIYLAEDIKIILALGVSILIYFYIIVDTMLKNYYFQSR